MRVVGSNNNNNNHKLGAGNTNTHTHVGFDRNEIGEIELERGGENCFNYNLTKDCRLLLSYVFLI